MVAKELLSTIDTLTPEELNEIQAKIDKTKMVQLENNTKNNADDIIKQGKEIGMLKKDIDKNNKDIESLKTITNVLRNDNTGKLEDYKHKCQIKVKNLLGNDKTKAEYILFNDCYRCWIYADIHHTLNVPRADCINVDDYNLAVDLIKKWRPSQWQKDSKIQEYIRLQEKDKLGFAKSKSLDEYLGNSKGGII